MRESSKVVDGWTLPDFPANRFGRLSFDADADILQPTG